jgi:hypothetical protein
MGASLYFAVGAVVGASVGAAVGASVSGAAVGALVAGTAELQAASTIEHRMMNEARFIVHRTCCFRAFLVILSPLDRSFEAN